jgi:hypothetical protein
LGLAAPGRSGWGSITKSWDVAERCDVTVRALDGLVDQSGRTDRVAFLKIDVEGYEFAMVDGALGVLGDHRPLVYCEFNDVLLKDAGRSSAELLDRFADLGYRPHEAEERPEGLEGRVVNLLLTPS